MSLDVFMALAMCSRELLLSVVGVGGMEEERDEVGDAWSPRLTPSIIS